MIGKDMELDKPEPSEMANATTPEKQPETTGVVCEIAVDMSENAEQSSQATDIIAGSTSHQEPRDNVEEAAPSPPPITLALEALLGGLDDTQGPSKESGTGDTTTGSAVVQTENEQPKQILIGGDQERAGETRVLHSSTSGSYAEALDKYEESANGDDGAQQRSVEASMQHNVDMTGSEPIPNAPLVEHVESGRAEDAEEDVVMENAPSIIDAPPVDDHPEWEVDSSPIESSSDDSSSDSSSDSDEEGDQSYKLLSPEEQARILMEGDGEGGSDDEGEKKGPRASVRTKNEVPEEVIPKPDVTITPEMRIEELGLVEAVVENIALIKAKVSGEYRVLESNSVLCLEDRSVIGAVAETLGRVEQPLYSVRFTNMDEIAAAGLTVGTKVFYSEQHSTYVFTQALKAFKGSDASNLHDEEVGDEEIEFSDDEAEAEHKRRVKQKKMDKRGGGKTQQNGTSNRGGHPLREQHTPATSNFPGLNYDEAEDDGLYKPLSRPAGYADTVGRSEPPQEGAWSSQNSRPKNTGRGDFRGRGRGNVPRGGSDRGRGRGGNQNHRGGGNGYSLPPQNQTQIQAPAGNIPQFHVQFPHHASFPPQNNNPQTFPPPRAEYSPQQPQMWVGHNSGQPNSQNQQPHFQNMPPPYPLPAGAFINPAFFPGAQAPGNQHQATPQMQPNVSDWNQQQGNQHQGWNQYGQQNQQGRGGFNR